MFYKSMSEKRKVEFRVLSNGNIYGYFIRGGKTNGAGEAFYHNIRNIANTVHTANRLKIYVYEKVRTDLRISGQKPDEPK